jgi:hypothetical protein
VAVLGDGNNNMGSLADWNNCFGPTWGKYKSREHPTPGNHDYMTAGDAGYFTYWGSQAGLAGKGYYSYDLGDWHLVVLNGNCSQVGGCGAGSAQETWLKADLAAHPALCTLAYWHQPLFTSSAVHPGATEVRPLWQDLYNAGAEFVVGTGGTSHYPFGTVQPNSQVRNNTTYGVLKLALDPGSYSWKFLPVAGQSFTDSGTGTCH